MKTTFIKIFLFYFLVAAGNVQAQGTQSFAGSVLGSWVGNGTLFGLEATFNMTWESELNDKFISLAFRNSFTDGGGTERSMTSAAYYNLAQSKGYWFDSRGMMLPLELEISDNSMLVLWGDEQTERGKTTYTIIDKTTIEVADFVYRDDTYVLFGVATYKRVKD